MDSVSIWLFTWLLGTLRLPPMTTPTPADHLAWAICTTARPERDEDGERPCRVPCAACRAGAVAVLRVAVEQVVPEPPDRGVSWRDYNQGAENRQRLVRFQLLDLVAKLEVPHA